MDCNQGPPCEMTLGNASISYAPESTPSVADDGFGFRAKSVFVQPANVLVPLNGGLTQWLIEGVNRSFAQTSFFRIGGDTREHALASLGANTATMDDATQEIRVSYCQAGAGGTPITVDMIYTLQGHGRLAQLGGSANLLEQLLDNNITDLNNTMTNASNADIIHGV